MNRNSRQRILLILGAVALFLLAIIAIYFTFFNTSTTSEDLGTGGGDPTFGESSGEREGAPTHRNSDRNNNAGIFASTARLRIISEEPIAGATTIATDSDEIVRSLERKTSHVFDTDLRTLQAKRVSSTTIPRIYEALWTREGEGVILRYLEDDNLTIKSYFANLIENSDFETSYRISGNFLPDNIVDLVLSPNKTRAFWLAKTDSGARGVISNPDGSGSEAVFESNFSEWLPQWFSDNTINMTAKASGVALGYSYNMPISSGDLNRNLGNITGLTTLTSPDGSYILYSEGRETGVELFLYNTATGATNPITIRTLPEKCAWANNSILYCGVPSSIPRGPYPDVWYQGKILFTDSIFRIDVETSEARSVYSPIIENSENIDIYKPFVSESGDYLIFNDKASMSLWALTL